VSSVGTGTGRADRGEESQLACATGFRAWISSETWLSPLGEYLVPSFNFRNSLPSGDSSSSAGQSLGGKPANQAFRYCSLWLVHKCFQRFSRSQRGT
jgi:hypothetical protein